MVKILKQAIIAMKIEIITHISRILSLQFFNYGKQRVHFHFLTNN